MEWFDLLELDVKDEEAYSEHGKVVSYEFTAYCDIKIFEDGFESWYYIGE